MEALPIQQHGETSGSILDRRQRVQNLAPPSAGLPHSRARRCVATGGTPRRARGPSPGAAADDDRPHAPAPLTRPATRATRRSASSTRREVGAQVVLCPPERDHDHGKRSLVRRHCAIHGRPLVES
jgi:hypothetical protein